VPAATDNAQSPGGSQEPESEVEDTRPWVVKVVKREATIGPHTFHLHEIYGLSSSSTNVPAATAPLPTSEHTYPPPTPATASLPLMHNETAVTSPVAEDNEPSSECLLCLSSPREVVLLPCRHLVACKECALNMIEFGAGGTITQASEPAPGTTAEGAATEGAETNAAADEANPGTEATAVPAAPATPAAPRRKRKAKGWFCPVCRQPYTSLLRITTTQPPSPTDDTPKVEPDSGASNATDATAAQAASSDTSPEDSTAPRGGLLSGAFRPAFLRGLSSRNAGQPTDLERQ